MNNTDARFSHEALVDENDTTKNEPEEGNKFSIEAFNFHLR